MWKWIIITLFTVVWVTAMWVVVVHVFRLAWGSYWRSKRQPVVRVGAKVKSKPARQEYSPLVGKADFATKALVFECEDGVERYYEVHDSLWDFVEVGDDGVLSYQGELFLGFEPRRPRHDMDALYQRLTRS